MWWGGQEVKEARWEEERGTKKEAREGRKELQRVLGMKAHCV